ncbi:exosortase-associated protein EpsI, B-type [Duganella callida]|uniref:EpsI family protein n=1 Tax=Duganella callida TaxID=2561932 RepID=A0A4Y9S4Z6_9BURK|nr:exosortase-associated protein EpsI, B-type [Duganella callida]TFW16407.1 EpsI family protein [Duganella callida]
MNKTTISSIVLGVAMLLTAVGTRALTPTVNMADQKGRFDLEALVPAAFGEWEIDRSIVPLKVDPATQEALNKIYNQTLARTYVNRAGERVMLSIAYGGDQSSNMAVHRPEVCYVAQGFNMNSNQLARLSTPYGALPVRHLVASQGARVEPITYWITVGNHTIDPGVSQKLQQLRYGLAGQVPDGMLVRVSSIETDAPHAYGLQQRFVNDMLAHVSPTARQRLIGSDAP